MRETPLREHEKVNFFKTLISFNWLLSLPSLYLFLLLVAIPVLYPVWMYKVAHLSEKELDEKPDWVFRFWLIAIVLLFPFMAVLLKFYREIPLYDDLFIIAFFLLMLGLIYTSYYLSKVTLRVEYNNSEYSPTIVDKVSRFLTLSLCIYGAAFLQVRFRMLLNQ